MSGISRFIRISPRDLRRAVYFKPLAAALVWMIALPAITWLDSGPHSRHPFAASAQAATTPGGCPTSRNRIMQEGCQLATTAQFEQAAVQSYLAERNLPASDAPLVYQY